MADNIEGFYLDPLFRNSKNKVVPSPAFDGILADTHCHLDMLEHPELSLARCAYHNVMFIATVVEASENPQLTYDMLAEWLGEASALLDKWGAPSLLPICRVVAGSHPHTADNFDKHVVDAIRRCAMHPLTAAIGEIGLDYHYDNSKRDSQKESFKRQLNLANEMDKPVILHVREAHDDALDILHEQGMPQQGAILHCFTSDWDTLEPFLDLGCYVAYGGALTFSNGEDIRDSAKHTPLNRIVTETDSPFMAPAPLRGTVCSPENVLFTTEKLLEVKGITPEEEADALDVLFRNALRFYRVDPHNSFDF